MRSLGLLALPLLWAAGTKALCESSSLTSSLDPTCWTPCTGLTTCDQCLASSANCHWCASADDFGNGHGWCASSTIAAASQCDISTYSGSHSGSVSDAKAYRQYNTSCPVENECANGHHDCDLNVERCVDKDAGYECQCKVGYSRRNGICAPFCENGCGNGVCVQPNSCQCYFGFVGPTCAFSCNCNGHSTCPGPNDLDACLNCHNRTKGGHCELCEAGYIRRGNSCVSCREYCHNHSDACVSAKTYSSVTAATFEAKDIASQFDDVSGQSSIPIPAICVNCSNFAKGLQCEQCVEGYFRSPKLPPEAPCMRCECNGHSVDNVCDPHRGDGCQCRNNTMTPQGCKEDDCWAMQCAMCMEHFRGTPVGGRQCYRDITVSDQDLCFVPDACSGNEEQVRSQQSRPLRPWEMSYFVLTPSYTNIDFRIVIDVGHGALDAFVAISDVFVAKYDPIAGCNALAWKWIGDPMEYSVNRRIVDSTIDPCPPGQGSNWKAVKIKDASDSLTSFVAFDSPSSILLVRHIENRAVITVPSSLIDAKPLTVRFYLVLRARGDSSSSNGIGAWGNLLYTQDQAHFDLFIFFAVFFAAFFLALSVILALWRLKMVHLERRHDRAQTVELLNMSRRPFISIAMLWKEDVSRGGECSKDLIDDDVDAWPFCFQNLRKKPMTVATLLVRMPGGSKAPTRLAFATGLLRTAPPPSKKKLETPTTIGDGKSNNAGETMTKKPSGKYLLTSSNRRRVQPC